MWRRSNRWSTKTPPKCVGAAAATAIAASDIEAAAMAIAVSDTEAAEGAIAAIPPTATPPPRMAMVAAMAIAAAIARPMTITAGEIRRPASSHLPLEEEVGAAKQGPVPTWRGMGSGRDQVVGCCGFFGHQFVAEHAGFFPRRLGRKAAPQDQQRLGGLPVGGAMRQHAFDHSALQSDSTPERVDKPGFMIDFQRHPECREGRFRQSGAYQQRLQAGAAAAVMQQCGDAGRRQ